MILIIMINGEQLLLIKIQVAKKGRNFLNNNNKRTKPYCVSS